MEYWHDPASSWMQPKDSTDEKFHDNMTAEAHFSLNYYADAAPLEPCTYPHLVAHTFLSPYSLAPIPHPCVPRASWSLLQDKG